MIDPIAAAIRNRQKTMAQVQALAPLKSAARERAGAMREQAKGVKETGARIQRVRSLFWVPGFFPTPRKIVRQVVELAELRPGMQVLEPSAGKGDIALAARDHGCQLTCVERVQALAEIIREHRLSCECSDFLELQPNPFFDRVLMNPPFERGIDRAHIEHAFKFLKPGGRLVAVACSTTGAKLEGWADQVIPLPAGSFVSSERSTSVNTCIVIKNK